MNTHSFRKTAWIVGLSACLNLGSFISAVPAWGQVEAQVDEDIPVESSGDVQKPEEGPVVEAPITEDDRDHWSFRPLQQVEPPQVKQTDWPRNEVDQFILAKLEAKQLRPLPEAGRGVLIRRLTFDLTGLPPTPAEVDEFAQDQRPDAYERLVDRLLASPQYGERWAQHWLDLARYAETDGFEHDKFRPQAWKYRDWVIQALNDDMPYDEFVRLQLAGDELRPNDPQAAVATGFCLSGPDMPDINLKVERRHTLLNEMAGTVSGVFLGLQFACAECHDHKYDPISQADFYRLRSFFDSADVFGVQKTGRTLANMTKHDEPSRVMLRGDFRRPGPKVAPEFPRIVFPLAAQDELAPASLDLKNPVGRRSRLARWLTQPDHPLATRVAANRLWQFHFGAPLAGSPSDFGIMGDEPTHPELLDWLAGELPRRGWSWKSMHRLLVTSRAYRLASRPDDPAWSPAEKTAARTAWADLRKQDADNRWLGRRTRVRLEGEAIRDAMLASADRLNLKAGGPGVMPPLPEELSATLLKGQWKTDPDENEHRRRSVYLFVRRNLRYPLFEAFDRPDAAASCPRRNRSTVAPQALMLLNAPFSLDCSRDLAGAALQTLPASTSPAAAMDQAVPAIYRRVLGRIPTDSERRTAIDFLSSQSSLLVDRPAATLALPSPSSAVELPPHQAAALVDLCLALFNLNEFVYLD